MHPRRVFFMTSSSIRHQYLTNALGEAFDLVGVSIEDKNTTAVNQGPVHESIRLHNHNLMHVEKMHLGINHTPKSIRYSGVVGGSLISHQLLNSLKKVV